MTKRKTAAKQQTLNPELRISFSYKDTSARPGGSVDHAVYNLMNVHTTGPLVGAPCCWDSEGHATIMCPQRHMAADVSSIDEAKRLVAAIRKIDGVVEVRGWYAEGSSGTPLELTPTPTPEEREYFEAKIRRLREAVAGE